MLCKQGKNMGQKDKKRCKLAVLALHTFKAHTMSQSGS